jgi:glucose/arabinose dehydrogenase
MAKAGETMRYPHSPTPQGMTAALLVALLLALAAACLAGCGQEEGTVPVEFDEPEPGSNTTGLPLELPEGFSISIFAEGLGAPRVMDFDPEGNLIVSIPSRGSVVALPDRDGDGFSDDAVTIISGLDRPHGIAFLCEDNCSLYVAETDGVRVFDYDAAALSASERGRIIELPAGGRHFTRTIAMGETPEGMKLFISVGSSCDVCVEEDPRRASILVADTDGSNLSVFASGLRNAVFMAFHPETGELWVTEMGRDNLGDDIPPDEINIVEAGKDYGWPFCYGRNIPDTEFAATGEDCLGKTPSHIDIQAHSAPLGLAFVTAESWPDDYHLDLLVAYHGSWNRTVPVGYKVVRFRLDETGAYQGEDDLVTGWLQDDGNVLGRPADLLMDEEGILYVSDDRLGVIYRVLPPRHR